MMEITISDEVIQEWKRKTEREDEQAQDDKAINEAKAEPSEGQSNASS